MSMYKRGTITMDDCSPLKLDAKTLASCIHCGLCLPACPTYLATGREMESPRGRIYLVSQWQQGLQEPNERLSEHIDSCLGCLGCQTACPSGVQYEEIITAARIGLAQRRKGPKSALLRFVFQRVLPDYALLQILGILLRIWQKFMGQNAMQKFVCSLSPQMRNHASLAPIWEKITDFELFTPRVPEHKELPATQGSFGSHKSNLFKGCVMDVFYNHVNHDALRLMGKTQGGKTQVLVPEQTCCGALAMHAGEVDIAKDLAWKNILFFENSSDPIVVTSAGCGAMLKSYGHLFEGVEDPDKKERAKAFASRVKDISEYLKDQDLGKTNKTEESNKTITYHAACHLVHAQKISTEPLALLSEMSNQEGSRLVPLPEAEHCCGSAGIYNLLNTKLSLEVLDRKLDFLEKTGAKTVVTGNPGCMLQLEAGIKRRGLGIRVCHLAEILDESYQ